MTSPSLPPPRHVGVRRPLTIGFIYGCAVLATTAIIGGTVLVTTRTVLFRDVREYFRARADITGSLLDGNVVAAFTRPEQEHTREYATAVRPLMVIDSIDSSIRHAFTVVVVGDSMRYVLDASPTGRIGADGLPEHKSIGETVLALPEVKFAWTERATFVSSQPTPTLWGRGLNAATPIFGHNGQVVGVAGLTRTLGGYDSELSSLDNVVLGGGVIGLLLALLAGIFAFRVEQSRLDAEAGLLGAKAAAEASARAKGEFLANMSHEIRTPLHGVLGMSEAMLASAHTEADRRSLEVINKSASSLLGILNDILDYSKLEAGRVDLVNAPFDPRALADDVTDLFAVGADERGLEIAVRETLRAERWPVGDSARMKQVLLNLVGNAVKFTERGHVQVHLETVIIGRQTVALRIIVKDTGIGIPTAIQARLFEQFEQGEASTARRFGGTGLGLAISRQLVRLMGGSLTVTSQPGVGTEFTLDLQLPVSNVTRPPGLGPRLPAGARALVQCAHPLTRDAIVEMLGRAGIGVDVCADRAAVLARLAVTGAYTAVLIDAPSEGMDAPPPLAGARATPPLILLTTLHQPLNNSTLTALGASAQLRRPVREDHLEALLADLAAGALGKRQGAVDGSPAAMAARAATEAAAAAAPAAKPRVMVVDDVELNLIVARAMLGSLGVEVQSAGGGADAITRLAAERFDLVLMDCHMPEVDGYEVTRTVRAGSGPNKTSPIVALSASAFAEDRQRALESGMNDFAPKPIELHGLKGVLTRWIPTYAETSARKVESTVA